MSFIQNSVKNTRDLEPLSKLNATAVVMNEILATDGAGNVQPATSGTTRAQIQGVANQADVGSDGVTQVLAIMIDPQDTWIADLTNNSNPAHNYQRMVLTDANTVNNTGTDSASGVVEQVMPYGPAANKQAIVRFV